jgi:hypothetical protein
MGTTSVVKGTGFSTGGTLSANFNQNIGLFRGLLSR